MNNNEKIAQYIQNIFHLENLQADDDTYTTGAISSTHWGNGITIRWSISNKFVDLSYSYSMGTHTCGFGADDTAKSASEEIVKFIGKILISQADSVDPATGMGQILAWPYNCNLAYVENTIEALQYGNNPIENSRKSIKSSVGEEENQIKQLTNPETFWDDVRSIVGYGTGRFHEDWDIKHLQRVADARYEELINSSKKPIKSGFYDDGEVHGTENWKGKENNWRGVPGVHMIWHGEWSDPELEYDGKVANMYDVESTLYEYAQEDGIDTDNDTEFNKYCQEHDYDVYSLFSSKKPIKSGYDNEIYRQAFGALLEDYPPTDTIPGGYRVLVDGNYETEFSADSQEEAIQKFKDYFAEKKGITNSKKLVKSGFEEDDELEPEYNAGWDACLKGIPRNNCPKDDKKKLKLWLMGWDDCLRENDWWDENYPVKGELDNSLTRNQRNLNKFFD